MRILAIRGRNLASLADDFEVDFQAEPLASTGIFAITGPTGAGKSTLLDAMCLALFNRLPRLTGATTGQVGIDESAAISAADTRAVLRHHCGEGFAEVDFIGRDRVRYRARWTVRRARNRPDGALQAVTQELTNLDDDMRIGDTRTQTLEAIRDRIGLSAEQFARAVMLAQGDFDAFVRADANDRAALLEKLTGTGIYARIGAAARRKAETLKAELAIIEQRIADQRGLDDIARADAQTELTKARESLVAAEEWLAGFSRSQLWYGAADTVEARVVQARNGLAQAQQTHDAAAMRREACLQRRSAAGAIEAWRGERDAARKAVRSADLVVELEHALEQARARQQRCELETARTQDIMRVATDALEKARPELEQARAIDRELEAKAQELAVLGQEEGKGLHVFGEAKAALEQARALSAGAGKKRAELSNWLGAHALVRGLALREDVLLTALDAYEGCKAEQAGWSVGSGRAIDPILDDLAISYAGTSRASRAAM